MSILQALAGHYERRAAREDVPSYGFSRERISYVIELSPEGEVVGIVPLLDPSGDPHRLLVVPQSFKRPGIKPRPFFLWDKTAYVVGMTRDSNTKQAKPPTRDEHCSFKTFHRRILADNDDAGLRAFLMFLNEWRPERYENLPHAETMLDTNVVFRLHGEQRFLHDRPAARADWESHLSSGNSGDGLCLVTGERARITRLHPALKGVRGAQSSGASIVSFNLDAFTSYGKQQGANAPVSERAAFAYTTALNALLAHDSRQRIQIGDATTVFWAEAGGDERAAAAAEDLFTMLTDPAPTDAEEEVLVSDKLAAIADGKPLAEVEPDVREDTRFFVLGLAPNAARLSIRFWYENSIGDIARRIGEHWRDLRLEPTPWRSPPPVWRLLYETAAQRKAQNIPATLGGALMRAILTGGRYPQSLLGAVVGRMRADKDINGHRVAICKACLARDHRLGIQQEDTPVSLNRNESNPAYRLGRLFAVYERAQRSALGDINATIKDRYFGAASATPASVFPLLMRNAVHHLASLRKDRPGLAIWYEREIDTIMSGTGTALPRSLPLEEQGRFAIGYHHQRAARGVNPDDAGGSNPNTEQREET